MSGPKLSKPQVTVEPPERGLAALVQRVHEIIRPMVEQARAATAQRATAPGPSGRPLRETKRRRRARRLVEPRAEPPTTSAIGARINEVIARPQKAPAKRPVHIEPTRRRARVAMSLAQAHQIQNALDKHLVRNQADMARQLGVTRAQITYLLSLMLLAPDIQERVLELEAIDGREPITMRALRPIARMIDWQDQHAAFDALLDSTKPKHHFTDEQIEILREAARTSVSTAAKPYGVSDQTIYDWQKRFGSMTIEDLKRLKELERENARLKKRLAAAKASITNVSRRTSDEASG